jgi:hypothetical protein
VDRWTPVVGDVTVRLRPHHVLCMLTFAGEGYSPEFIANFAAIVARIGAGEAVELIDGSDDVCAPLEASDDTHCGNASVGRRDRAALLALVEAGLPVAVRPLALDPATLARLRELFAAGTIRAACRGCEWFALCSSIADGGFAASSLDA